jgi:hypothetical protein
MFNDDAHDSAARAEQGRKNADLRDFFDSVKLDIKEQADAGNNRTTYKVSERNLEFVAPVIERLTENEYEVEFNDDRRLLTISWNV